MKAREACVRCGRVRYEDRMRLGKCVHGPYWLCYATTSCKVAAKARRKAERLAS